MTRTSADWTNDLFGLAFQGIGVTWIQLAVLPRLAGDVPKAALPAWLSFLLAFVLVDYLYYWNHRSLHHRALWPFHARHHSAADPDWISTARNFPLTPLLIVYVWVGGAAAIWIESPAPFFLGLSVGSILDLWRHSGWGPRAGSRWHRALSTILILPDVHASHHRTPDQAFGANFVFWDKLHGTWR